MKRAHKSSVDIGRLALLDRWLVTPYSYRHSTTFYQNSKASASMNRERPAFTGGCGVTEMSGFTQEKACPEIRKRPPQPQRSTPPSVWVALQPRVQIYHLLKTRWTHLRPAITQQGSSAIQHSRTSSKLTRSRLAGVTYPDRLYLSLYHADIFHTQKRRLPVPIPVTMIAWLESKGPSLARFQKAWQCPPQASVSLSHRRRNGFIARLEQVFPHPSPLRKRVISRLCEPCRISSTTQP
jgi:hypothetical protein